MGLMRATYPVTWKAYSRPDDAHDFTCYLHDWANRYSSHSLSSLILNRLEFRLAPSRQGIATSSSHGRLAVWPACWGSRYSRFASSACLFYNIQNLLLLRLGL